MSHSRLLKHNRIFLEPGNINPITTVLSSDYSSINNDNTPLQVVDTNDFSASGFITINNELLYYDSKTVNSFQNIVRGMNGTTIGDHSSGDNIYQTKRAINDNNTVDTQLSGWYIDGNSNQASLRVYDSPVILPGVIRLKHNEDSTFKFQGCIDYSSSTPIWVDFNATQGEKGDPGDINTVLRFSNVGGINSGDIIKTTELTINNNSSIPTEIEVRGLKSGLTSINNEIINTINIETETNDITLTSKPLPYTWNLCRPMNDIKNISDDTLNSFGETIQMYVIPGKSISKGQVITSNTFTSGGNTYIGVEPLTFSNVESLDGYTNSQLSGIVGIATQSRDATGLLDIEISNVQTTVLKSGIGLIKIDRTNTYGSITTQPDVDTTGRQCLLGTSGYGFHPQIEPNTTYYRIGYFIEKGIGIAEDNNYCLISLNPTYIEI
jgi:hypothetical protein